MRNPIFPQAQASFWDQIPLQMAQNPKKNPFSGLNISQNQLKIT
jgi:hypothetical protein